MKRNEIFEKALEADRKVWEEGRDTDFYKNYGSYKEETIKKSKKVLLENGCPSVAVLRAYNDAKENNSDVLLLDGVWDKELDEALQTLEKGKVKDFYLGDQSTGLMNEIHGFVKGGWKMEVAEIDHPYLVDYDFKTGKKTPQRKKAIRFYK